MGPGGASYPASFSKLLEFEPTNGGAGRGLAVRGGEGRGRSEVGTIACRSLRRSSIKQIDVMQIPIVNGTSQVFVFV